MLRVGLTGGLGSGKSTVAAMLREMGAEVSSSDEIGRALMSPGQPLFDGIVQRFGPEVVQPSGALDRRRLAAIAFESGRLEELNALVHPAVIEAQARWMDEIARRDPAGVATVESALIFETQHAGEASWRTRFDRIVLVVAPEPMRIGRYLRRVLGSIPDANPAAVEADARNRMAAQWTDERKAGLSDFVIRNDGGMDELRAAVAPLYEALKTESERRAGTGAGTEG